jgi:ketosteroid isomerase-like protein
MAQTTWFEDYLAAWNTEQVDKVMAWMADDIEYEDTTIGHSVSGTKQMTRFVEQSFAAVPGASFDYVTGADLGEGYYIEWVMQPMGVRGVSVGTRRDGRIVANRDYWDGRKYTIGG